MKVNFNPEIVRTKFYIKYRMWIIGFITILLIITGFSLHYYNLHTKYIKLVQQEEKSREHLNQLLDLEEKYKKIEKSIDRLEDIKMAKLNYSWSEILNEIGYMITSEVSLKALIIEKDNIIIEGKSITEEGVHTFIDDLNKSSYFNNFYLSSVNQIELTEIEFKIIGKIEGGFN